MKRVIAFLAMVALLSGVSGAWAQEQKVPKALDAGQYAFDVGGKRFTVVSVRDNNTWRHDQSTMYAIESNGIEYYKNDAGKIRARVAEPKMVAHDTASSSGLVKQAVAGFISNVPTAAGIGFGLRFQNVQDPDRTTVNTNGGSATGGAGGVGIGGTGVGIGGAGGAGGAGGSATITNTGGIGNVKTISNDANGNGTILGGNIF